MKKKTNTVATSVAIVLGILLLITGYMWLTTEKKLEQTLTYGADSASFQRDKIKTECLASDPESQMNCTKSLTELSTVISDVQKGRALLTASTTTQTAK